MTKCHAMVENILNRHSLLKNLLGLQSLKMNIPLPCTTQNLGFERAVPSFKAAYAAVPASAAALTQLSLSCNPVNHLSTFEYFSNVPLYPNAFKADPLGK